MKKFRIHLMQLMCRAETSMPTVELHWPIQQSKSEILQMPIVLAIRLVEVGRHLVVVVGYQFQIVEPCRAGKGRRL
jgi:hypothetical protein